MTNLSPAERQALRERHAEQYGLCVFCSVPDPDLLGNTLAAIYPCDTIKVLDALDHIAAWVDHRNGMDVHGAIGRIQDMLLGTTTEPECEHSWLSRANANTSC